MTTTEGEFEQASEQPAVTRDKIADFTTVVDWHAHPDLHLQALADDANSGVGVPVTLFLPSGIVTGTTISSHEFFEGSSEWLRDDVRGTDNEEPVEKYVQFGPEATAKALAAINTDSTNSVFHQGYGTTSHIHLTNVETFVGPHSSFLPRLRVKLTHVAGWAYGRFPYAH